MLIMELRHSYSIGNLPGVFSSEKYFQGGRVSCALQTTLVYIPYYIWEIPKCQ
jgi:hypothetical protein